MTKNEMETFRHQLLKLERNFKEDANALADEAFHNTDGMATGNLSNIPVEDRAELGSDENCEDATIGLLENTSARLEEIHAALERIDNGAFGSCEKCGREISHNRLQSVPYSRRCIECATQKRESASPGNL